MLAATLANFTIGSALGWFLYLWKPLTFPETYQFQKCSQLYVHYWFCLSIVLATVGGPVFISNKKANFFGSKRLVARGLARYQPLATKWRISVCGLIEGLLIDTVSDHQSLRLEFRVIRCGPHRSEFGRINNMHILEPSPHPALSDAIPTYFHFTTLSTPSPNLSFGALKAFAFFRSHLTTVELIHSGVLRINKNSDYGRVPPNFAP